MEYSEKLKNPKWQKKRLEVLNRDNFTCCLCSDTETELHVHHLKYTDEPWDAPLLDLQTLCSKCHELETALNTVSQKIKKAIKIQGALVARTTGGNLVIARLNDKGDFISAITTSQPLELKSAILKLFP